MSSTSYAERWRREHPEQVWNGFTTDCSLCRRAIQGHTSEETLLLLQEHQQGHPEWSEYQARLPTLADLNRAIMAAQDSLPDTSDG